eukprot:gene2826-4233_t
MAGHLSLMRKAPKATAAVIFGFSMVTLVWGETLYFNYHTAKLNVAHYKLSRGDESKYFAPYKTELVTEDVPEGFISDVPAKKMKYWKVKWDTIKEEAK